jgi:uncharacterized protein
MDLGFHTFMKRVFIIHGWGGYPEEGWFPWLKEELEKNNFEVFVPEMPNSEEPEINSWVNNLSEQVGQADENTFFVGHSIGCQTILRYLETLNPEIKVGKIIFVAGWVNLLPVAIEEESAEEIAQPWLKTPLNWEKIKLHSDNFVTIFSNDDLFVPESDAEIFKGKLNAKIIIENKKGHFSGEDGIKELPVVLNELLNKII